MTANRQVMPDDHSELEPPLPIPNRTVKRFRADDSAVTSVKVGYRQAIIYKAPDTPSGAFSLSTLILFSPLSLSLFPGQFPNVFSQFYFSGRLHICNDFKGGRCPQDVTVYPLSPFFCSRRGGDFLYYVFCHIVSCAGLGA